MGSRTLASTTSTSSGAMSSSYRVLFLVAVSVALGIVHGRPQFQNPQGFPMNNFPMINFNNFDNLFNNNFSDRINYLIYRYIQQAQNEAQAAIYAAQLVAAQQQDELKQFLLGSGVGQRPVVRPPPVAGAQVPVSGTVAAVPAQTNIEDTDIRQTEPIPEQVQPIAAQGPIAEPQPPIAAQAGSAAGQQPVPVGAGSAAGQQPVPVGAGPIGPQTTSQSFSSSSSSSSGFGPGGSWSNNFST